MTDLPQPTGQDVVCEAVGAIIDFWGFKRVMGRIWALLYLSARPLSASEICDALQISAGSASMTLNELQTWGVVKRAVVPGSRAAHYRAEHNLWKMVSKVFREREHDRFLDLAARLREGGRKLRTEADAIAAGERAVPEDVDPAEVAALRRAQADKSEHLALLAEQAAAMLEALLDGPDLDLSPMIEALRTGTGGT